MANKHKGEVALKSGDETYTLRFSSNAIVEIEGLLDGGIGSIVSSLQTDVKVGTLRAVLWGGLRQHHPGLTLLDAGNIIDEAGVTEVSVAIGEAFRFAFPASEGAEENPRTAA